MKKLLSLLLALLMVFALSSTALAAVIPAAAVSAVTVDGVLSAGEWGEPSFHGDKNTNWSNNAAFGWDFWQNSAPPENESYDVWLDHDASYAYVAVRLNNTFAKDTGCTGTGDMWTHASLAFTLSAYDASTTVPRITFEGQEYEQYSYWAVGLVGGTTKANFGLAQGRTPADLADSEYAITYDDATSSYIYEMAIPLSKTNISPDSEGMVFSMDLRTPLQDGASAANRYLTCPVAQRAEGASGLGAENFQHTFTNPLIVFTGGQPTVGSVGDSASAFSGSITLDGVVSAEEWGQPVVVTSPDHCQDTWGSFWKFGPENCSPLQAAKLYVTNDADNVYLAFTLDHVKIDKNACTDASLLWQNAHFGFDIAKYDSATTVPRIEFEGNQYEQYTGFWLGFVNGQPTATVRTQGIDAWELPAENFAIQYDEAAETITYEVKLPVSKTNINLDETRDVALSVSAAGPFSSNLYDPANPGANRYNITTGVAGAQGAGAFSHKDNALKITLNAPSAPPVKPETPETWIGGKASAFSGKIKLDGKVSEAEWGKAVVSTTPGHATSADDVLDFWSYNPGAVNDAQNAKLYVTNDKEYLYVAATLTKAQMDTGCTSAGELWQYASFGFSVSGYDKDSTVKVIEFEGDKYEQYTSFCLGFVNGKPAAQCKTQGIDPWELPAENYAVAYDAASETYTYELKVPMNRTNINLHDGLDIALSASIAQQRVGTAFANVYQIATGYAFCGGPGNMAHKDGNALRITLNDTRKNIDVFVKDTAPAISQAVTIDGRITDAEWGGGPVVSTTPGHCQATWGNFWQFDPSSVNPEQNVRLYVTNDAKYLYIGATIDECDLDETCTNVSDLYKSAHFIFSVSGYDKDHTVKIIPFEGQDYEQYTGFMMGLVNGEKASYTFTQGHAAWELPAEDYAIVYDPEARTYTYEVRIPFVKTNITSSTIALSASVGAPYTGGDAANRYNITTGAATCGGPANWAHKDNALVIHLLTNPETGDPVVFAAVGFAAAALALCGLCTVRRRISAR